MPKVNFIKAVAFSLNATLPHMMGVLMIQGLISSQPSMRGTIIVLAAILNYGDLIAKLLMVGPAEVSKMLLSRHNKYCLKASWARLIFTYKSLKSWISWFEGGYWDR